jgi:hypothetical protein
VFAPLVVTVALAVLYVFENDAVGTDKITIPDPPSLATTGRLLPPPPPPPVLAVPAVFVATK